MNLNRFYRVMFLLLVMLAVRDMHAETVGDPAAPGKLAKGNEPRTLDSPGTFP